MIKKQLRLCLVILSVLLAVPSLAGCSTVAKILADRTAKEAKQEEREDFAQGEENKDSGETKKKSSNKKKKKNTKKQSEDTDTELSEDMYKEDACEVFAEMSDWVFIFSSGAGGWDTQLRVEPDGSFSGRFCDSDMGDTGKGYENGTEYECVFTGKFSDYVKSAGPLMHSLSIESIEYENEPDTEEIKDGVRYVYSGPYGIEGLDKVTGYDAPLVFLEAGAVTSVLGEEEMNWVSTTHFGTYLGEDWDYVEDKPEYLPYAVLLNTVDDYAFFSCTTGKNKTNLVNKVKLPGLRNTELTINDDGTYYCVDENDDGTFRVINTCYKTSNEYNTFNDADTLVRDCVKHIYKKSAPSSDDLHVTSPKDAFYTGYSKMAVNGEHTAYAFWYPDEDVDDYSRVCDGRFMTLSDYEGDNTFVYAYIIECEDIPDKPSYPDTSFVNYYITSLMLTGKDDDISSAGEGDGAVRAITCDMKVPVDKSVEAKELVWIDEDDTDLIKKYQLEDANFDDGYEVAAKEKKYRTYDFAEGSYTPLYIQYPEDNFHKLYYVYDIDEYMNRYDEDPDNSCLMYLYLNENDEIVYGYEEYVP